MSDRTQNEVIRFLADPATHGGTPVEQVDTHASVIFLAGTRALKLKRAVTYDYLDFSTPGLRRRFCEAELQINRQTAPSIYRRVVPVVRTADGSLALDGEGTPVDWVIEMNRFDEDALFDRLADLGRLDLSLMTPLAGEVASCHARAPIRPQFGGRDGIARVIGGNAEGFRTFGRGVLDAHACDRWTAAARATLRRCASLLESRRTRGFVRQCHGDLHLGNIVLVEDRPTLFDAIEFNDDIACVDVMYDLAFLLMDLWQRALPRHANLVLNSYLAVTRDYESLAALPLFLSCRAAIRAKTAVTAAHLQSGGQAGRLLTERAREYLALARRLQQRPAAAIIAIGGLSGTGKSTLARAIAPFFGGAPGAVVLRSDHIRKRMSGVSVTTRLPESAYRPEISAQVYTRLLADAAAVARAGQTAIVDAVFARSEDRAAAERAARTVGVPFAAVWLDAPMSVLLERVRGRGPDASDADESVVRLQGHQRVGDVQWPHVDASADLSAVEGRVRACLATQAVRADTAA